MVRELMMMVPHPLNLAASILLGICGVFLKAGLGMCSGLFSKNITNFPDRICHHSQIAMVLSIRDVINEMK